MTQTPGLLALPGLILLLLAGCAGTPAPYQPRVLDDAYMRASAAYLDDNLVALPDGWTYARWQAADGTRLRWGLAQRDGASRGTVLVVPGYGGTLDIYGQVIAELMVQGYDVAGLDLRGQGGSDRMLSNPEKPYVTDYAVYAGDLAGFVDYLSGRVETPLLIYGESFGGHVALRAAGDHPDLAADGLVLIAPAVRINTAPYPAAVARSLVAVTVAAGKGEAYAPGQQDWAPWQPDLNLDNPCGTNIATIHTKDAWFAHHPEARVSNGPTNKWVLETMRSGDLLTDKTYTARIDLPVVLVTVGDERIVQTAPAQALCRDGLAQCMPVHIEEARHCLNFEAPETRQPVFRAMESLIEVR
ncbi:alpha/beta fold hydrolase [Aquisalinus flavus]|uniref:Lysophospholipase n=1 Tax=Aquisalinus flavus TaxID=1526572 RepID=A0A8J2V7K5_9PROT|nr:alpha/beta hydrolase [Aquisalinus flavus]MBD0426194.1 alpha/beta hydrolase [Aquisalinus flavus]UNE48232.1 alpha/beta hydrolase [Aquisalinus flavus]GGD09849.1 lysophospholipase [Aquisalinus flavus]